MMMLAVEDDRRVLTVVGATGGCAVSRTGRS
jgi:hypothetical protein